MASQPFIAHTRADGQEQPLIEHLRATARLAKEHASPWGGEFAYLCGLAHDIGKYSDAFQARIRGGKARVDHSTAGGQLLNSALGGSKLGLLAAYCTMGHHGGLPNGGSKSQDTGDDATLHGRLKRHVENYGSYKEELELPSLEAFSQQWKDGFDAAFFVRMAFSALIDADWLDTERFCERGNAPRGGYLPLSGLRERLAEHVAKLLGSHTAKLLGSPTAKLLNSHTTEQLESRTAEPLGAADESSQSNAPSQSSVPSKQNQTSKSSHPNDVSQPSHADQPHRLQRARNQLLRNCLEAADAPSGLFTLTAPTGSGKTISSLAFALEHAARNGMRRVIYVVPYNTIIEQNAAVFEGLLGEENVLRHYCDAAYDGDDAASAIKRNSIENWDYPLIVTSSVQFFESLFSNKPSKCRKLHNIARSVLVFDEAQMIPVPYLVPCVRAIKTLATQYGCTAVLASATQSSLDGFLEPIKPIEITQDPAAMNASLRRTAIRRIDEPLADAELVDRLLAQGQVLCVVNTRRRAQELFGMLSDKAPDGAFHLSTTMHHAHRKRILDGIRGRLVAGKACRVVSTSLVEAGVDLDFGTVFREMAGLDSIVQAAGRCNREGKRELGDSVAYVFVSEGRPPPRMIQQNVDICAQIARQHGDLASLEAIGEYFRQLHYVAGPDRLDQKRIVELLNDGAKSGMSFAFADAAAAFRMIDDSAQRVVYALYEAPALEARVRSGERSRNLFRAMGKYAVSLYEHEVRALGELGAIERPDSADGSVLLLASSYYDERAGVTLAPEGGQALFA